jgi:hypothetical protein
MPTVTRCPSLAARGFGRDGELDTARDSHGGLRGVFRCKSREHIGESRNVGSSGQRKVRRNESTCRLSFAVAGSDSCASVLEDVFRSKHASRNA